MDKSWMRTSRTKKQYIDGVEAFIKYAVHNLQKMRNINPRGNKQQLMMPCPCTTCLNHIEHKVEEVQFHLFKYGIDLSYTKWDKHGEKDEQATTAQIPVNATTEFVDDTDFDMDFGSEIPTDGPATVEMVNATKESFDEDDLAKFQELLLDAEKPLYKGCPDFTKLSAIVKLLNLKGKYGASDKFFTELLGLLKKMLPAGNEMVEKTYQAKKLMRMMGSGYKKIHVCSNNCILYWKDNKELTVCPTCGISRWKVDNKTHKVYENIPAKVMWYFPIIPRLQRLFKLESISEDLRWHATRRITDGVLCHPTDSQAWRIIDEKFPEIAKDPRNLRLGISVGGVDVNSGTRHHSVWLVLSVIYNLPPWLWVDTYDASTKENFNLCVVVLWTINDYPALGTLCGCPYSGFKGHHCRPAIQWNVFCWKGKLSLPLRSVSPLSLQGKAHLRHKQVLKTENPGKRIAFLENEHSKSFAKWLREEVERELAIDKESVSEIVRWISYGPRATVVKYASKSTSRFWGSKLGCNESDVKPSWKDIEKAKACMLAKAQASEASSKAKVEACGSKAKLQASTKTLIVKALELGNKKVSALVFYGPSTQGLLDAYGYNTIEEYLSWNYFPSTYNESTDMETTDKRNTDKDCIVDSNSAMSKGKYVPVCKKNKPNVYSHVQVTGSVLGLPNVTTWDEIEKKMGARKSKTCADKAKGKRKVSCGS
ncbi:putative reverse transcriptase domain-containing protein [Tanacetum coccineum]